MPDNNNKAPAQKPTVANDNRDEKRGDVVRSSGNKVHGDKLEGMIPGKPVQRPVRDDGREPE
jgi:hypothetical protein